MNWGLYSRIIVSLGVVLLVSMLSLGYVLLDSVFNQYLLRQTLQMNISAYQLERLVRELPSDKSDVGQDKINEQIRIFIEGLKGNRYFAYAVVVAKDGKLLGSSFSGNKPPEREFNQLTDKKLHNLIYLDRPIQDVMLPISRGDEFVASVHVAYFRDINIFSEGDEARNIVLILGGIWLISIIAIQIVLKKSIRPLSALTERITATSLEAPRREISEDLRTRNDEVGILACAFDAMIANLQKSYSEMEKREAHFRQLVETANVIPWELDLNSRRITYVGPQAKDILGYDLDDWYQEKFWLNHVCPDDVKMAEKAYRQVSGDGGAVEIEYRIKHADGRMVWVRDWIHKSTSNPRSPVLQGFMFDVDERVKARQELQRYREHLENVVNERTAELLTVNQELQSFAHSLSQDLRVPLRVINGFSQAMLEDYADVVGPEGQDYLKRICAGTKNMGKMIDDILILSQVTRQDMRRKKINLSQLAEEVVSSLRGEYENHPVDVVIDEDMMAYGDPELIKIVLTNLLSNAWKFTTKTKNPKVEFSCHHDENKTVFSIKDNGAGFDMQYAEKLFLPFRRLHNSEEFEGTGVGLATVKRIILRHGGEVWGEGKVNEGAIFHFTLSGGESVRVNDA